MKKTRASCQQGKEDRRTGEKGNTNKKMDAFFCSSKRISKGGNPRRKIPKKHRKKKKEESQEGE